MIKEELHQKKKNKCQEMFSQIWTQLALVKSEQREDQAKGVNLKFKGEDKVRVEDST